MTDLPEGFSLFDPADYLDDTEDMATFLQVVLEESGDDPTLIPYALGVIARSRNMAQLARDVGMSREGLYKALSEGGNPSFITVLKVAHALGLRLRFQNAS